MILHDHEKVVEIKRRDERFKTKTEWLESRHSFSFGPHYDPKNTNHGLLIVNNDDVILPGTGFMTHPHRDMEIVTWTLEGELEHKDSTGRTGIIYPGLAQRMSAGSGIWHSEINPSKTKPVRLVQMWVLPDTEAINPGYEQLDIGAHLANGGLVPVASGRGHKAAISIRQKDAVLWAGRLKPGESVNIPEASRVHIYIAKGSADIEDAGILREGDAARMSRAGSPKITADAALGTEVLIWESA